MLSFSRKAFEKSDAGGSAPTATEPPRRRPVVGLALGAGAARGWSHIGVLRELAAHGLQPDIVAGTSIGAVVGGCYVGGQLDALEGFARSLSRRRIFSLMDVSFSGSGLIGGTRLKALLNDALADSQIENMPTGFAAVATEMGSGHEVWLSKGHLVDAVRASYALPGIFEPVQVSGRWLFDGALVNPVPVTVCRALGAELVIAVNIIADTLFRGTVISDQLVFDRTLHSIGEKASGVAAATEAPGFFTGMRGRASNLRRQFGRHDNGAPGIASAMMDAFNITQDRIARSRLAGDPPDVMISARLGKIGLFDFHRAEELISMGREAARRAIPDIAEHIALMPTGGDVSAI
ncbi:MAG: family protein rssA [Hyphomicrobiales bacterium]|nr:family protein rssA [Hyphomicrobiales bacterium]